MDLRSTSNQKTTSVVVVVVSISIALTYCILFFLCPIKGKPPTKKAKVLQKQPLMAKLAAYAQYQANQQNQAKSKSGEWLLD